MLINKTHLNTNTKNKLMVFYNEVLTPLHNEKSTKTSSNVYKSNSNINIHHKKHHKSQTTSPSQIKYELNKLLNKNHSRKLSIQSPSCWNIRTYNFNNRSVYMDDEYKEWKSTLEIKDNGLFSKNNYNNKTRIKMKLSSL